MVDKAKLDAFSAYDFDSNEDWKAHLRNVELPAGSAASTALTKVKAKWYKKNVDSGFDPSWASSDNNTSTGGSTAYSSQQPQQQSQQQPSSQTSRPAPSSRQAGPRQDSSRQLTLAILQGLVLLLTILYMQPLKRGLSTWAYKRLIMTILITQGYKVHGANGRPAAWTKAAITTWAQRVLATSDAHYFILAAAAFANPPVTLLLVPYVVLAAYGVGFFLAENFSSHPLWQKYGALVYRKMLANQQKALQVNAQSEIMLGFQLIVGLLLPGRAPMLLMATWQVLRLRFWSVDAAIHHRTVWAAVDRITANFRQQFPLLQKAVTFGVNFFHAGRR